MSRLTRSGWVWNPRRLGRSLPIYGSLWLSRLIALGLTGLLGLFLLLRVGAGLHPDVAGQPEAEKAEQLVKERLAADADDLPKWSPGPPLPETERPAWMPFPPPPLWQERHPDDQPLRGGAAVLVAQGRADLAAGNPQAAAARFKRAAQDQPTWEVLFAFGRALQELRDDRAAIRQFDRADARLDDLAEAGAEGPALHAAQVATRYAAGRAALQARDCLVAIHRLRRAVSALKAYVDENGALVHDRKLPFRVREAGVDNHAVWGTLAEAYVRCSGDYPANYPSRYGEQNFLREYRTAAPPEVQEGPFPATLAACIAAGHRPSSRCWAYSNLNKVLWVSGRYLPGERQGAQSPLDAVLLASLARLVYNTAWLAADADEEEDRVYAGRYLEYAARLDRQARVPGLARSIAALGRHLAPLTGDNSALAEPYRRRPLADLTLDAGLEPEELKGLAWALSEEWLGRLRAQQPEEMLKAVDDQILRAGPHGESLRQWKAQLQEGMQSALAEEIRLLRDNHNLAEALAIRDFQAPWLGPDWPDRARGAWVTWDMRLGWGGLALAFLLGSLAFWLVHRLVVYPYLVYTADYYQREHGRRHADLRKQGKLFTREEIEGEA